MANELNKSNVFIVFLCRIKNIKDINELKSLDSKVHTLPWNTSIEFDADKLIEIYQRYQIDMAIIDHYRANAIYQKKLYSSGIRFLQFDGCIKEEFWADVILNPSFGAKTCYYETKTKRSETKILKGPKFAFLRNEFKELKEKSIVKKNVVKILISFGGGDDQGATLLALKATQSLAPNLERVVIASPHNPRLPEVMEFAKTFSHLNIDIRIDEKEIAKLMASTDIGLISGGTTLFEAAAVGLPALIIQIAKNQKRNSIMCHEEGVAINLGDINEISSAFLKDKLSELMANFSLRKAMATEGPLRVDCMGTQRVSEFLLDF